MNPFWMDSSEVVVVAQGFQGEFGDFLQDELGLMRTPKLDPGYYTLQFADHDPLLWILGYECFFFDLQYVQLKQIKKISLL